MTHVESIADWNARTVRRYPEKAVQVMNEMAELLDASPHPPTREQIAEVVAQWRRDLDTGTGLELEDRLVALIQNGSRR